MGKEKTVAQTSFWYDLFHVGVYKRNQGRIVRQVTFAAMAITLLLAAWKLFAPLQDVAQYAAWLRGVEYVVPGLVALLGAWCSYRLVNYPRFADFLISVESEMNKVSWPSRSELIRSSLVVIFLMFFLAIILFGFDLTWQALFQFLGVTASAPPAP